MKRKTNVVLIVSAVLAVLLMALLVLLAVAYVGVFGIYTEHGDRRDAVIPGLLEYVEDYPKDGVKIVYEIPQGVEVSGERLAAVELTIQNRLEKLAITDYRVDTNKKNRTVTVWVALDGADPLDVAQYLGRTADLEFRKGETGDVVLTGRNVTSAKAGYDQENRQYVVQLTFDEAGKQRFSEATRRLYETGGIISIWLDGEMISAPVVQAQITTGEAVISGAFETMDQAEECAFLIDVGAMPQELVITQAEAVEIYPWTWLL